MNFFYIFRYLGNKNSGVNKKIMAQVRNLSNLGFNCFMQSLCVNNDVLIIQGVNIKNIRIQKSVFFHKIESKFIREISFIKELGKEIESLEKNDILYMRIPYPFFLVSNILKRNRKCKIVIEYQTIEPVEYKTKKQYWYLLIDALFGNDIRKYADAIVGVTYEITQYELSRSGDPLMPHITIGNGFDVNSVSMRKAPHFSGDELHLLCVANVSKWHGLDRLILGSASYYGNVKLKIHIAGDGAELPSLKKLTHELGLTDSVIFHGFTTGKDLDTLFNQCHIAIGSLGIHRIGLKEASILKAREYCARGIPFIIACNDPDFPDDLPYIYRLPLDDSSINITEIIGFAETMCLDSLHPQIMREYAFEHLDWSIKMKKLKEFLETLIDDKN